MYLRTTQRKNKDGSVVQYYALAHNERHPDTGKPVARIIHSFGRADELNRDDLVRLCHSIARVCGVQVIDPLTETDGGALNSSMGLPKNLKLINTLALGTPWVVESVWVVGLELGLGWDSSYRYPSLYI